MKMMGHPVEFTDKFVDNSFSKDLGAPLNWLRNKYFIYSSLVLCIDRDTSPRPAASDRRQRWLLTCLLMQITCNRKHIKSIHASINWSNMPGKSNESFNLMVCLQFDSNPLWSGLSGFKFAFAEHPIAARWGKYTNLSSDNRCIESLLSDSRQINFVFRAADVASLCTCASQSARKY